MVGGLEEHVRVPHTVIGTRGEKLAGGEQVGQEFHHRAPLAATATVGGT